MRQTYIKYLNDSHRSSAWGQGSKRTWREGDFYVGHLNISQFNEIAEDARAFMAHQWMPSMYARPHVTPPPQYAWLSRGMCERMTEFLTHWIQGTHAFCQEVLMPLMPAVGKRLGTAEALAVTQDMVVALVNLVEDGFTQLIKRLYGCRDRYFPGMPANEARQLAYGICPRYHSGIPLYQHERIRCYQAEKEAQARQERFVALQRQHEVLGHAA